MKTILILLTAGVAILLALTVRAADPRPNIVYIVVDNVTFEHMGKAYGGENVTPAMDSIAERGVRFERMYVTSPMCIPSRYSILSGRYPEQCTSQAFLAANPPGAQFYDHASCELEPGRPNLATALRKAGYHTGFVGKFHNYDGFQGELGPEFKLEKKTHISDPELNRLLRARNDAVAAHIASCGFAWVGAAEFGNGFGLLNHHGMKNLDTDGVHHNLEWEVEHALQFLDENAKGNKPFFLYMATKMCHLPFRPEFDLLGDYETIGRYTERGMLDKAPHVPMPPRREIYEMAKDAGSRPMVSTAMRYLDFGVKAVLDRIETLGLTDNTIVVFLSDNNQAGKSTVYEGGIRVPAAMMWPKGIPAGQTNQRILSSLDIVATLMAAAGATEAPKMDLRGKSFLPMVTGNPKQEWEDVFMAQYGYGRAIVTPRWKYVAVRYPEEQWKKIRAEDARKPDAPDFGRNPVPARKWQKRVKPNLHPQQMPHAYNIHRYWHAGDQNHIMRVTNFPALFELDQLYDLERDPDEQTNLAGNPEFATVLKQMQDKMKAETRKLDRPYGEFGQ
jgi:arylsulfatase A-like enzyme